MAISTRRFAIVSLLVAAWLSLEYIALGPYSWMYGYGASLETIPVHLALAQTGSTWTLWAPSVAGGLDRLSFWGNADPFNLEPILFTLLPTWLANGTHVFLQRAVAMYFTARVCSDQLRLPERWCLLAALVHAGLGYFTVGEMFAFPGVPLLLWLLPTIEGRARWWAWALLAGALFSSLVTFSQSAPYLLVFAVGWSAIVLGRRSVRTYLTIVIFFVGLTIVELPQTLATLANAPASHRAAFAMEPIAWSLAGLFYYQLQFDFLDQDKLLRAVCLALPPIVLGVALAAVLLRRARHRTAGLLLRVIGLYGLLSLKVGWIGAQALAVMVLPWLSGLYMGRFYTLPAAFVIAVMAALSANMVSTECRQPFLRRGLIVALAGAVSILLIWPKFSLYYPLMVDGWGEKHYQAPALAALRQSDTSVYRVASVLDLQPGYAYGQGFETADGWSNLYPAVYRDLWLRVIGPLLDVAPATRSVFDPPDGRPQDHYIFLGLSLGLSPIGLLPGEDPVQSLQSGFDVDRRFNLSLLSLLNVKYVLSRFPLRGEGLQLVHAPVEPPRVVDNYDYATGLRNDVPQNRLATVAPLDWPAKVAADGMQALERKRAGKDLYIYQNARVLARYRFVSGVEVRDGGRAVLDRLGSMGVEQLAAAAVIERADAEAAGFPSEGSRFTAGAVTLTCYGQDEIALQTRTDGDGFLVIAMTWNAGWQATVDGQPAALIRTNHAQFGLSTPPGEHIVQLRYAPWYGGPLRLTSSLVGRRCA